MIQILRIGQKIKIDTSGLICEVVQLLGSGGQGEVYKALLANKYVALKWYYLHSATSQQRASLETLIRSGSPDEHFLWPLEIATSVNIPGFGYIMPLRDPAYKGIVDLMKRRVEPTFRVLATLGLGLSQSFLQLHSKGLCYRDISFSNVFFHPVNGDVLICDNDNVTVNQKASSGVIGTPRFMAPEIVRGESAPSIQTDLFSLSVLLFYIFMMNHPLEGIRETAIRSLDLPAMNRLYGTNPLFIFDPDDSSNHPDPRFHKNALVFWKMYPQFFRNMFIKAFTAGLHDPDHRIRESEWRAAMVQLRDLIMYCSSCTQENFYDPEFMPAQKLCWYCGKELSPPPRLIIGKHTLILNLDTKIYPHHINDHQLYDFSNPVAEVSQHPHQIHRWGLKNLSPIKWTITTRDGVIRDVDPGRTVPIAEQTKIDFGAVTGFITMAAPVIQ